MTVPVFPAKLMELVGSKPITSDLAIAKPGDLGTRNDTLFSLAGRLLRSGLDQEMILRTLLECNSALPLPLEKEEVERIAQGIMRYSPAPRLTEVDVAEALARRVERTLKFSPAMGWMYFNGRHWTRSATSAAAVNAARDLLHEYRDQIDADIGLEKEERGKLLASVNKLFKSNAIHGVVKIAAALPEVHDIEAWEDPAMLFNFKNGTLDLNTFELRPHDPADRLQKIVPYEYDPSATCPNFERVLADVLDPEVVRLLQQMYGYGLKGTGELQQMGILVGVGRNGKSTIMEAIMGAYGEYAVTADPSTFTKSPNGEGIPNDVAALAGARLISVSETSTGSKLNEARIKRMLGGEQMVGRFLYREAFTFVNRALMMLGTNMAPVIDGSDFGTTRRMTIIPFQKVIGDDHVDPEMPAKLKAETPGIMNWLLKGLRDYQEQGKLTVPETVNSATSEFARGTNQVLQFAEAKCERSPGAKILGKDLYRAYIGWSGSELLSPMSKPAFNNALQRTYPELKTGRVGPGIMWHGIRIKA